MTTDYDIVTVGGGLGGAAVATAKERSKAAFGACPPCGHAAT